MFDDIWMKYVDSIGFPCLLVITHQTEKELMSEANDSFDGLTKHRWGFTAMRLRQVGSYQMRRMMGLFMHVLVWGRYFTHQNDQQNNL